jgi:STAM-binding protein
MAKRNGEAKGPPTQPMNVEQIVKKAQNFDYNPLIPLKYWLRTAATLLKEVWRPAVELQLELTRPLTG